MYDADEGNKKVNGKEKRKKIAGNKGERKAREDEMIENGIRRNINKKGRRRK